MLAFIMKPILINNIEFAEKNLEITGEIEASSCERLLELLNVSSENLVDIRYTLIGAAKKQQLPNLHLSIDAKLPVLCQRCLAPMQLDFALSFDYIISAQAPAEVEESDEIDWLEASLTMNVNELVEDELLIAIPIAPKHENGCAPATTQSGEKPNPFAVLKGKF